MRWLAICASLVLTLSAAAGIRTLDPVPSVCGEIDPNTPCFGMGGNFEECKAESRNDQGCYECGVNRYNKAVCVAIRNSAACGCREVAQDRSGAVTECSTVGVCEYVVRTTP